MTFDRLHDMAVSGESLVGGEKELTRCMEAWGYRDRAGGLLKDAVTIYQSVYRVEIDAHCRQIHGEPLHVDGDIGLGTARVINGRFCDVSDFQTTEEARWPDDCVNEITVAWNFESLPGATKEETDEAWDFLAQYERLFEMRCPRRPDLYGSARVNAKMQRLPGPTLANSNLANNNCGYQVRQNYDSTISWRSKKLRDGVIGHEFGHAVGMRHTPQDRNSLLYPSANGQVLLNDTDIAQLIQLGYKRRTEPLPPPPPDPPPPGGPRVSAIVRIDGRQYELVQANGDGGDNDNPFWPT